MNILIAGASGFIGQYLVHSLQAHNHITVLGRDENKLQKMFGASVKVINWNQLDALSAHDYQAVINLCGHNIAASRWSDDVKAKLIESRVQTGATLINWLLKQGAAPHFYSASAIGIYGMQSLSDQNAFDENSPVDVHPPKDFLNEIGMRWENALQPAIEAGIPVTITRFGVVLKKGQGMLKKMTPAFYFGLGSVIGDGRQVLSWVHIEDIVRAYQFLLNTPELTGAFNLTSPHPVSQAEFATILAKTMHRPLLLKTPAFLIRTLFGEMGDCLLLNGQRVVPKRLTEKGYQFKYTTLEAALEHEFQVSH